MLAKRQSDTLLSSPAISIRRRSVRCRPVEILHPERTKVLFDICKLTVIAAQLLDDPKLGNALKNYAKLHPALLKSFLVLRVGLEEN